MRSEYEYETRLNILEYNLIIFAFLTDKLVKIETILTEIVP